MFVDWIYKKSTVGRSGPSVLYIRIMVHKGVFFAQFADACYSPTCIAVEATCTIILLYPLIFTVFESKIAQSGWRSFMTCLLGAARAVAHFAVQDPGYPTTDYHRRRLSYFSTVVCRPSGRRETTRAQLVETRGTSRKVRGVDSRLSMEFFFDKNFPATPWL